MIGATSSNHKLRVVGTGTVSAIVGSTNAGGAQLVIDGDANGDGSGGDYASLFHNTSGHFEINNRKDASILFKTGSSENERMRIDSSGRVLIGTTSSEAFNGTPSALQIEGASDATTRISLFRTANDNGASVLVFAKARNTSHALLNNNDTIGKIEWYGADGKRHEPKSCNYRS